MGVGAILSNRRPRYRCLKAVDFGYFSVLVLDCVRGVFSSQKRTLFIVLNLLKIAVFVGHYTVCRLSGMRLVNSKHRSKRGGS